MAAPLVLYAENNPEEARLIELALEDAGVSFRLHRVESGEAVLDYLYRRPPFDDRAAFPFPSLLLLDLSMPRLNGLELLQQVKADPELRALPVCIFSTSQDEVAVRNLYDAGAASFLRKPLDYEGLVNLLGVIDRYWMKYVSLPERG
jgi:two-component system response regulator